MSKDTTISIRLIENRGAASVVEWESGGSLNRTVIPQAEVRRGRIGVDVLARGIPYGLDIAAALADMPTLTPERVASELHKRNIWTADDIRCNPKLVKLAVQEAQGDIVAMLLLAAAKSEREARGL